MQIKTAGKRNTTIQNKNRMLPTVFFALFFLAGCVPVGPAFVQPDPGVSIPERFQATATDPGNEKSDGHGSADTAWWRAFNDPVLNELVDRVSENNWDIKKATAGILEARSQLAGTRADRFPSINLKAEAKAQEGPATSFLIDTEEGKPVFRTVTQQKTTESYNLALPASYEIDLWGRLSHAENAVMANLVRAEEIREAVGLGVIAEAVGLYFQIGAIQQRMAIAENRVDRYQKSLDLVEGRYERGLTSVLDVRQARRALTQASSVLPDLENSLGKTQFSLSVLEGTYPRPHPQMEKPAISASIEKLSPVPAGLPSQLLEKRPDIRGAEAKVRAAAAQVGVATANRLPRLTLTGTLGYITDDLSRLFRPESELWQLAQGIVAPVFNAGKLKAGQQAAEAALDQARADYAKTVLTAFAEVETALLTREKQLQRREALLSFLAEARATQEIAEGRYRNGLADYLRVLEAQQTRFAAEENLVLVDLTLLTNRVALHRALGGGWGRQGQGSRIQGVEGSR